MYRPFDLSGRAAVVTGGNGGIGYGMARALLAVGRHGVDLGFACREDRGGAAAQLAGRMWRRQPRACPGLRRRRRGPGAEAFDAQSVAALGRMHACFANAGVSGKGTPMMEMTLDEFRRVQRINVEGVFLTFRAAARHMAAHGQGGSLVATASTAAVEGAARNSHYGASKGAVTSYRAGAGGGTGAPQDPRQFSILPGWIVTEMTERSVGNDKFAARCCRASPRAAGARATTSAASPSTWPATPRPTPPASSS
jgi:NAD(P)-dependent dehydrogenase (short-subunit alcohol dehydrogenase family)